MKKLIIIFTGIFIFLISCTDKKKSSPGNNYSTTQTTTTSSDENKVEKSGSFTFNGTSFTGKSSTQYFGDKITGQFSVLCQQDEPFALLQAVFANEKEATGTLKPIESFMSIPAGETHITLSGTPIGDKQFVTKSNSTGSITVEGKKMIIKDLKLFNSDNKEKVVTANI